MKDITEVGEECGLLSGPRTQRLICAHVGTPDPGWISCSCFLLRHHNTTTELQSALQPPPQKNRAVGLLPTGCSLSTASNNGLSAQLAPDKSRISIACLSLPSFTALSRLLFLCPLRHTCKWQAQGDLVPADHHGAKAGQWPAMDQFAHSESIFLSSGTKAALAHHFFPRQLCKRPSTR